MEEKMKSGGLKKKGPLIKKATEVFDMEIFIQGLKIRFSHL